MTSNNTPQLLEALRLVSLRVVAESVKAHRNSVELWRQGVNRPEPAARKRLVQFARRHAKALLDLADRVEREGREQSAR